MAEELRDIEPLRPLLVRKPLAILSDIDGTLAPIVPNPEDARISTRARAGLRALIDDGVGVGLISGRALEKARQMVDIPDAYFAANHGLSIAADGIVDAPEELRPYVGWAQEVIRDASELNVPGIIVEDKGPVVAFHYRMSEDEDAARVAIESVIGSSEAARNFRLQQGRKVIELRPPLAIDKGTAAETLVMRMGARSVLAMGDDVTDIDMFRAVRGLQTKGFATATVSVWSDEVEPQVLASTDYFVRGVEGVEWLLEEIVRALRP
jgi:trehalose 6-phosphate phosphatase